MKHILIGVTALLLLSPAVVSADTAAPSPREQYQQTADRLYEEQRYRQAKSKYVDLARLGDRYAQYRLSTMYLDGKAGKRDEIKAFAWAEVAAQDNIPVLVKYRDLVWDDLATDTRPHAAAKGSQYLKRYNDNAIADNMYGQLRRELRNCTGSRLGASCSSVKLGSLPVGAGIIPGDALGGEGARAGAAARVGLPAGDRGRGGVEDTNLERIQTLTQMLQKIETYLDDQTGIVELGDFEIIEDDIDRASDSKSSDPE